MTVRVGRFNVAVDNVTPLMHVQTHTHTDIEKQADRHAGIATALTAGMSISSK